MKKLTAVCIHLFFAVFHVVAQAPSSFWTPGTDKVFNSSVSGNPNDVLRTAQPLSDGGFLLVGLSNTNINTNIGVIWAVRLDSTGKKIAEKTYPVFGSVSMSSIAAAAETSDGFVIVANKSNEPINKNLRFMVSKSDLEIIEGTEQLSPGDGSSCVARLANGTLLLGSPGNGGGNRTARLEVLQESDLSTLAVIGNQLPGWLEIWGKNLQLILPTPDGGCYLLGEDFVIGGETGCNGTTKSNLWVCRLGANLVPQWSRTYGGATTDVFTDAELRDNGNLLVLGRTECSTTNGATGPNNIGTGSWILELDPQGEVLYAKSMKILEPMLTTDRVLGFALLRDCPDALLVCGNYRLANNKKTGYVAKVRLNASSTSVLASFAQNSGTWKREYTTSSIYAPDDLIQLPFTKKIFAWGFVAGSTSGTSSDFWAAVYNPDATPCAGSPFGNPTDVVCGETKSNQTTTTGATDRGQAGSYIGAPNIANAAYDGPDKTYRLRVNERTNLRITLDIAANNVDLDMFLFKSNANGTPINGPIAATAENNKNTGDFKQEILERVVDPGTYYLVVDGRTQTDKGVFTLKFDCGCATCSCAEPSNDLPGGRKLLTENFEAYKLGNIAPQSTRWTPDPASTGTAGLPQVVKLTNETQTLRVTRSQQSVFYDLAPLPNNRYRLSFQFFVATNQTASYSFFKTLRNDNANRNEIDFNP